MNRNPLRRRLYARLSGRRAVAHAKHRLSEVDVVSRLAGVLRAAAATGDWVTPYAIHMTAARWVAAGIDGDVSAPITGNENAREQAGASDNEVQQ